MHGATYESKKASKLRLYDWDPRPIQYQNTVGNAGADLARNLTVAGSAKRDLMKAASAKREASGGPEAEPPESFLGPRPLHRRKRPIWRTAVKEHPIRRPTVKDVQGQNIT